MRQITKIIVHCSATLEGKDFTVADITRWHKQRKFVTIGYTMLSTATVKSTTADRSLRLGHIVPDTTFTLLASATLVAWRKMGKHLKILGHLHKNSPLSAC